VSHDVIISYSTIDKSTADAVCAKLEARDIRCWIAPRDILPGSDYAAAIISAIDSAKILVLIFSSHANASENVKREAERAVHDGLPMIPFRIEDVEPNASLQYYISAQHWLDALTPPLERHILKLADTVSLLLDKPIPPPPTRRIPPQPQGPSVYSRQRDRETSLLNITFHRCSSHPRQASIKESVYDMGQWL
jgi:TIR domain